MTTMRMRLALFKTNYGNITPVPIVREGGVCWADDEDGYSRLTPTITVEFPLISVEERNAKELVALDKQEQALRAKFQQELTRIEGRRQDLLCLTMKED